MLIAICGVYYDIRAGSIRGNGKNITAMYLAYNEYQKNNTKIYTNFKTKISETFTINELLEKFRDNKLNNTLIIIDEAQIYLNNSGVKVTVRREIIQKFIAQSRKEDIDIILITQRFSQLHKELREQIDVVLIPFKYHYDYNKNMISNVCLIDNCKKSHIIRIFNINTMQFLKNKKEEIWLNPSVIGDLYDSNEIVLDDYVIEKKKK